MAIHRPWVSPAASRRWRVVVLAAAVALAACSDRSEPGAVTADAYVAALGGFMPPAVAADEQLPVVYVVPIGDVALDLDTQVAVIDAFAERFDVRFVDTAQAAIDASPDDPEASDAPHLVGIGTIHATPPYTVRIEQYADATRTEAHRVTLVERSGSWHVDSVADVEPEVLVGDG